MDDDSCGYCSDVGKLAWTVVRDEEDLCNVCNPCHEFIRGIRDFRCYKPYKKLEDNNIAECSQCYMRTLIVEKNWMDLTEYTCHGCVIFFDSLIRHFSQRKTRAEKTKDADK